MIDWENEYGVCLYGHDLEALVADTKDWVPAVHLGTNGGWNWADLYAFYSPRERRYFWLGGWGCSCHSWGDDIATKGAFVDGSKDDLRRALRTFAEDNRYDLSPADALRALDELAAFKEPADE